MQKTLFDKKNGCIHNVSLERIIDVILIIVFTVLLTFFLPERGVGATDMGFSAPSPIVWEQVERVLKERPFKSQEELLQLFYLLSRDKNHRVFSMEKDVLGRLRTKITTLFPLDECDAIELWGPYVIFKFSNPQDVFIPNTWLQASLQVPRKLVLKINDEPPTPVRSDASSFDQDPETRSVIFSVKKGYIRIHFSFLLKLFGGKLRDADGTELVYQINDNLKLSRLLLHEITPLNNDSLKLSGITEDKEMGKTQWIDIRHPDFPATQDIGISEKAISFLGTKFELLPDKMIRLGEQEPMKNEEALDWFSKNIEEFKRYASSGSRSVQIEYIRTFGYFLEERRFLMTMAFQGGKKRNKKEKR